MFVFILKRARVAGLGPEAHTHSAEPRWLRGRLACPHTPHPALLPAAPILPLPEAPRDPTHQASAVPHMELARRLPTSRPAQASGQTPRLSPKKSRALKNPSSAEAFSAGAPVPAGWRRWPRGGQTLPVWGRHSGCSGPPPELRPAEADTRKGPPKCSRLSCAGGEGWDVTS